MPVRAQRKTVRKPELSIGLDALAFKATPGEKLRLSC
jgi:hypothetical protein